MLSQINRPLKPEWTVPTEKREVLIKPVLANLTRRSLPIPSGLSLVNILHHAVEPNLGDCSVELQAIQRAVISTTALPQSLKLILAEARRKHKMFFNSFEETRMLVLEIKKRK